MASIDDICAKFPYDEKVGFAGRTGAYLTNWPCGPCVTHCHEGYMESECWSGGELECTRCDGLMEYDECTVIPARCLGFAQRVWNSSFEIRKAINSDFGQKTKISDGPVIGKFGPRIELLEELCKQLGLVLEAEEESLRQRTIHLQQATFDELASIRRLMTINILVSTGIEQDMAKVRAAIDGAMPGHEPECGPYLRLASTLESMTAK